MKKFILLISAWLSLHASAQIETTRYGFTYTANNPDAGEYTTLPLPAEFRMIEYKTLITDHSKFGRRIYHSSTPCRI